MQSPNMGQKVSLTDLKGIARTDRSGLDEVAGEPVIVSFKEQKFQFDFIWRPKDGAKRLYVFFAGDADRAKREPPVFHRWKWADKFDGHCLFVADPTLFLERTMGLGWYVGTAEFDCMRVIAPLVNELAERCGLERRNVISYGSSGGGFAALKLGEWLPGMTVVAINPQTDITAYHGRSADKFLRICFAKRTREEARSAFPDRLTIGADPKSLRMCRIIYAQNDVDVHHHDMHYKPFRDRMSVGAPPHDFTSIIFSDAGGHSRAETADVLAGILRLVETD